MQLSIRVFVLPLTIFFGFFNMVGAQTTSKPISSTSNHSTRDTRSFEVISIRPSAPDSTAPPQFQITPDGYRAINSPLLDTIMVAYFTMPFPRDLVTNLPTWAASVRYDIEAKVSPDVLEEWHKQNMQHKLLLESLLRSMLVDRCNFSVRLVSVPTPGYALVLHKKNLLTRSSSAVNEPTPGGMKLPDGGTAITIPTENKQPAFKFIDAPMSSLASFLSLFGRTTVVDRTNLPGRYNFILTKREADNALISGDAVPSATVPSGTSWNVEKLGLILKEQSISKEKLIIDRLDRPSSN